MKLSLAEVRYILAEMQKEMNKLHKSWLTQEAADEIERLCAAERDPAERMRERLTRFKIRSRNPRRGEAVTPEERIVEAAEHAIDTIEKLYDQGLPLRGALVAAALSQLAVALCARDEWDREKIAIPAVQGE